MSDKPYEFKAYPSWRYHPTERAIVVSDPDDEDQRAPYKAGWRTSQQDANADAIVKGPTFEEYVAAGYRPESYPPDGYEAIETPGLVAYRAEQAEQADAARIAAEDAARVAAKQAEQAAQETAAVAADGVDPFPYFDPPPTEAHDKARRGKK